MLVDILANLFAPILKRGALLAILLFALLFAACYRPKEGCLDLAATNLDVNADKSCETCCTYPSLYLSVRQKYDTLVFVENKIYENALGQFFRLKSASFYLSDFEVLQGQDALSVSDTLNFKLYGNSSTDTLKKTLTNDFVLLRRSSDNLKIGSFRNTGLFTGARFRVGLNDEEQQIISRAAPANHPLQRQQDSLWHGYSKGYVFAQVIIATDTALANTVFDTISLTRSDLGGFLVVTPPSAFLEHRPGFDLLLKAEIDYKIMLSGIDWVADGEEQRKAKLALNLPLSIYFQ
jgi:hypothetical protein